MTALVAVHPDPGAQVVALAKTLQGWGNDGPKTAAFQTSVCRLPAVNVREYGQYCMVTGGWPFVTSHRSADHSGPGSRYSTAPDGRSYGRK